MICSCCCQSKVPEKMDLKEFNIYMGITHACVGNIICFVDKEYCPFTETESPLLRQVRLVNIHGSVANHTGCIYEIYIEEEGTRLIAGAQRLSRIININYGDYKHETEVCRSNVA